MTLEAKKFGSQESLRPDLYIAECYGAKWRSTSGYGEARAANQAEDHHLVCCDLLKIAAFCKYTLDKQRILGIHIVGRTVAFYVLLLPAMRLYTMLKLAEIKLPDSLQGLPSLVAELPYITSVLDAFDNLCVPTKDVQRTIEYHAPMAPIVAPTGLFLIQESKKEHAI